MIFPNPESVLFDIDRFKEKTEPTTAHYKSLIRERCAPSRSVLCQKNDQICEVLKVFLGTMVNAVHGRHQGIRFQIDLTILRRFQAASKRRTQAPFVCPLIVAEKPQINAALKPIEFRHKNRGLYCKPRVSISRCCNQNQNRE